jgi:hypothetical protein
MPFDDLMLAQHGVQLGKAAVLPQVADLITVFSGLPPEQAGVRISELPDLSPYLVSTGLIGFLACRVLGPEGRAVRAILFDKTESTNWSLAWHQDRTICVRSEWKSKASVHGPSRRGCIMLPRHSIC